jgi:arginine deiminase
VHGYDGSEISLKGDGGPTCLTAPIWRMPEVSDAH